jgi:hypothetical protein
VGLGVVDGLKVGVRVQGADVSGGFGARNRHETPAGSGAPVGFQPASGPEGLRRRERSANGGNREGLRRRFRRPAGRRSRLCGRDEGAGHFRQIRPAVNVLRGADAATRLLPRVHRVAALLKRWLLALPPGFRGKSGGRKRSRSYCSAKRIDWSPSSRRRLSNWRRARYSMSWFAFGGASQGGRRAK